MSIEEKIEEFNIKFTHWNDGIRLFASNDLTEKELFVLDLRRENKTLEEVGKALCVTRERIRQIEAKANEKIRMKSYFTEWLKQTLLDIQKETEQRIREEARKQAISDCIECVRELDHGSFLGEPVLNKKTVLSKLKELE